MFLVLLTRIVQAKNGGTCQINNSGHAQNAMAKKPKPEPYELQEMERLGTSICKTKSSITSVVHSAGTPTSSALQARVDGETYSMF
jgi:hypothetical protein